MLAVSHPQRPAPGDRAVRARRGLRARRHARAEARQDGGAAGRGGGGSQIGRTSVCRAAVLARGSLPAAEPVAAEAEGEDARGAERTDRSAVGQAARAHAVGGCALGRSHHPGAVRAHRLASRATPRPAGDHLPARVHRTLGGTAQRDQPHPQPPEPAPGNASWWPSSPVARRCHQRCSSRSWHTPTGCRCSSRS